MTLIHFVVALVLISACRHASGTVGPWIIHYTYDALGRLVRAQRPLTGFAGHNHIEHYYYDGARRVQDIVRSHDDGGDDEQSSENETSTPNLATWADREYIHTAGPGSYIDEYVCEVTNLATSQAPLFPLQDANYTVVGLVNASGAVARQHTFDPYGQLLVTEDLASAPRSRLGHQGLFFDRLDAPQGSTDLSPMAVGQYMVRNRTFNVRLQRWNQSDPNGTALQTAAADDAGGLIPILDALLPGIDTLFLDGANRHAAYRSSPTNRTDPAGLFMGLVGFFAPTSTMDVYMDHNDQAIDAGQTMSDVIHGILADYADRQDLDADWASEWESADDWLSMSTDADPDADRADLEATVPGLIMAGGETTLTKRGRRIHGELAAIFRSLRGWAAHVNIPGTRLRPDAFNRTLGIVVEFKPNNERARRLGERQLQKYVVALQRAYPEVKEWITLVVPIP